MFNVLLVRMTFFNHYVYIKIVVRIHYNIIFLYKFSNEFLIVMVIK